MGQFRNPVSGADRLSPVPNFIWVLCVRAMIVRVSVDFVGLGSFVFHYWGDRSFVPAATCGFAFSFVGFALTAGGAFVSAGDGMG